MNVAVRNLRQNGRRVKRQGEPDMSGELSMHTMSGTSVYSVLQLLRNNGSGKPAVIATLYEPQLISVGHNAMLIRGIETIGEGDAAASVLQEWACRIE